MTAGYLSSDDFLHAEGQVSVDGGTDAADQALQAGILLSQQHPPLLTHRAYLTLHHFAHLHAHTASAISQ